MRAHPRRALATLLIGGALSGSLIAFAAPGGGGPSAPKVLERAPALMAVRAAARPASLIAGFNPLAYREANGALISDLPGGKTAQLTLDPGLQAHLQALLQSYAVPFGSVVALEPQSGRVLAYVSHSSADPNAADLARDPSPPSASVFKLITSAALLDAGVPPETRVCYGGGLHRLVASDLVDDPRRDRACATFEDALGGSINAIIAKLADRNLDRVRIDRYAQAFGFGHALPFDAPTQPSPIDVPEDRLELARTAAGFWHMHMSPLHAALIAATIANGGVMPRPSMVERIVDAKQQVQSSFTPGAYRTVIARGTAKTLSHMMLATVAHGTSHAAFVDPRGRPFLPGIAVAGKTGSLNDERPFRAYSWWVGFAPENTPEIAVAALVINDPLWRIKSSFVAREALRYYLVERKAKAAAAAAAAAAKPSVPPPPPPVTPPTTATPATSGSDVIAPNQE